MPSIVDSMRQHVIAGEIPQAALDALPDPIFLIERSAAALIPLNSAAARIYNIPKSLDDVLGDGNISGKLVLEKSARNFSESFPELDLDVVLNAPDHSWFTHFISAQSESACDVELHIYPLHGNAEQFIAIVRPIAIHQGADQSPHAHIQSSFHDPLTGLPNRRLFARRLERAMRRAARGNYHFAVLFVDLDNFKVLNNQFGHLHGDDVLVAVGKRLQQSLRPQDMVVRRDGDEFTILLDDLEHPSDAEKIAQRIVEELQKPLALSGSEGFAELTPGASIGIAPSGDTASTADELIARADRAMYHAKALGGGTYMLVDRPAKAR